MKLPLTPFHTLFASMTTDNLREGQSNKFHSRARVLQLLKASAPAKIVDGVITMGQATPISDGFMGAKDCAALAGLVSAAAAAAPHDMIVTEEVPSGMTDGVNGVFALARVPIAGSLQVWLRRQRWSSANWTLSGGSLTMTGNAVPLPGDEFIVSYRYKGA